MDTKLRPSGSSVALTFSKFVLNVFKDNSSVPGYHREFGVSFWLILCDISSPYSHIGMLQLCFPGR